MFGAVCYLGCKSGYPMGGANEIQCLSEQNVYPPTLSWKWMDLQPFCKGTGIKIVIDVTLFS